MASTLREQLEALWPEKTTYKQLALDIYLEASEIERHWQAEGLGQTARMAFPHFTSAVKFFEGLASQRDQEISVLEKRFHELLAVKIKVDEIKA